VWFALAALLVGCAGVGGTSPRPTTAPIQTAPPTPRRPDLPAATPPAVNVIPQSILDLILADASSRALAPVEDLSVQSQEEVTWNDGSLGCPEHGMMYTQALVDGYRVVIAFGDKIYDYRG